MYYLSPLGDEALKTLSGESPAASTRGVLLLANYFFLAVDEDVRLTRRIHDVVNRSQHFSAQGRQCRPFVLVTQLGARVLELREAGQMVPPAS